MTNYFNYNEIIDGIEKELHSYCKEYDDIKESYSLTHIKEKYIKKRNPDKITQLNFNNYKTAILQRSYND